MNKDNIVNKWLKRIAIVAVIISQFHYASIIAYAQNNKVVLKDTHGDATTTSFLGNKESRLNEDDPIEASEEPETTAIVETEVPSTELPATPTPITPITTPTTPTPESSADSDNEAVMGTESETVHAFNHVNTKTTSIVPVEEELMEQRTENSKTFKNDDSTYTTDIYFEPIHKEIDGEYVDIDLDLQDTINTYSLVDTGLVENLGGYYNITFFDSEEKLYTIVNENGFEITELTFDGNSSNYLIDHNTIQYNNVYDGIDFLYSLGSVNVKENILLTKPQTNNSITTILDIGNLEIELKDDKTVLLKDDMNTEFTLYSPYLVDNNGIVNENVTMSYYMISATRVGITYQFDLDWINDAERSYPVAIDPIVMPNTTNTADVTSAFVRSMGGLPMQWTDMWVGNDIAISGSNSNTGIGRSIIHFNMPNIGADMEIVSSTLSLSRKYGYSTTSGVNVFTRPSFPNVIDGATFDNVLVGATQISSLPESAMYGTGYKDFDITAHTKSLYEGNDVSLILVAQDESDNVPANVFWTEGGDERPHISITYRLAYDVDPDLDINTMDARLRIYSKGINEFETISIDGIAKPKSTISFDLYEINEDGAKTDLNHTLNTVEDDDNGLFFIDPIYVTNPKNDVQEYDKEDVNYTTDYEDENVLYKTDTFYEYKMNVVNGSDANTNDVYTDKFMIHEVKLGETLASLAAYYGNTIEQIKLDNNLSDNVIKEGDLIIIRVPTNSPKLNANDVMPPLMIEEYVAEYKYRGPTCLYGCYAGDPINVSSGNYYHDNVDFVVKDYKDIEFIRYYNSLGEVISTSFGNGFSNNYDQFVFYDKDDNLYYFTGDGKIYQFRNNNGSYEKDIDTPYSIEINEGIVTLTEEKTNQKLVFNEYGILDKIMENNGHYTKVIYNEYGQIEKLDIDGINEVVFNYGSLNTIESIVLPDGSTINYEYNAQRQLIKSTDSEGYSEIYDYDSDGRLIKVIDENGDTLGQNTYDNNNRVIKQVDGEGNVLLFLYDENGTTIRNQAGNDTTYEYDEYRRITKLTYSDGTTQNNVYDQNNNNLLSVTNDAGLTKYYEYNEYNYVSKIADFDGTITEYQTDEAGHILKQTNQDGTTEENTYDANGNLLTHKDVNGNTTRYTYDDANRVLSKEDVRGNLETYTYNGNLISTVTNEYGITTTYTYNDMGFVVSDADSNGRANTYTLDSKGNVLSKMDAEGGTENFEYDGRNNIIKYTDQLGAVTTHTYDSKDNLISSTYAGLTETFQYDQDGQKISHTDTNGNVEYFEYDLLGHLISTTDVRGNQSKSVYDKAGNLIESIDIYGNSTKTVYEDNLVVETIDAYNQSTKYEYDEYGRNVRTIYPTGEIVTNEYNEFGQVIKTVSSKGVTTEYIYNQYGEMVETIKNGVSSKTTYDSHGRTIESVDALGNATITSYDAYGNIIETIDALGQKTTYTYDKLNRKITTVNSLGGITTNAYDSKGNIVRVTDALGYSTETTYDVYSRIVEVKDEEGYVQTTYYNVQGSVDYVLTVRNNRIDYSYNQYGDLINTRINDITVETNEYDSFGRVKSKQTLDESKSYEYDNHSQTKTVIDNLTGLITTNEYDSAGNLVRESNNANQTTTYEYDEYYRQIRVINSLGKESTSSYNELDQVISNIGFDGITTTTSYDELGRVISTNSKDIVTINSYDANGNLIQESVNGVLIEHEYDELNRLIKTTDPLGNMELTVYDLKNQIISKTDKNGNTTNYQYDGKGNETIVTDPYGNTTKTIYDADNNPLKVTDAKGNSVQSEYNEFNQIVKTVDERSFETLYEYSDKQLLVKIVYPYGYTHSYAYGTNQQIIQETNSNGFSNYNEYDLLNNVIKTTDGNGNVTSFEYDLNNNKTKTIYPNGLIEENAYDTKGNLIKLIKDGVVFESNTYDAYNRLISSTDAMNRTRTLTYDSMGRINTEKDFDGLNLEYSYDDLGQTVKKTTNSQKTVETVYDSNGNVIKEIKNGIVSLEKVYDANGNVIEEYKDGITASYEYNEINQLVASYVSDDLVYKYDYDESGNNTARIDNSNNVTVMKYDAFNNLIEKTDTLGNKTRYDFDGEGNLVKVEEPNNRILNYSYDGNNNNLTKEYSVDKTTILVYDVNNQLIESTDENGFKDIYAYDHFGNQIKITKPDGTVIEKTYNYDNQAISISASSDTITNSYDNYGNLISISNAAGIETRTYDEYNRLISVRDANGNTTAYEYDLNDNQIKLVYANGVVIQNEYNDYKQLVKVTKNGLLEANYQYDKYGYVSNTSQGNGLNVEETHNIYGYTLSKKTTNNGALVQQLLYEYDSEGNLESEQVKTSDENYTNTFEYDENNELVSSVKMIDGNQVNTNYVYNIYGNKSVVTSNGNDVYSYNDKNQIESITTPEGTSRYYYNSNGSVRNYVDFSGQVTAYQYDDFNRLIKVSTGPYVYSYEYDGNGNRIESTFQDSTRTEINNEYANRTYFNYNTSQIKGIVQRKYNDDMFEAIRNQIKAVNKNNGCVIYNYVNHNGFHDEVITDSYSYGQSPETTAYVNDVTKEFVEVLVENNPENSYTYTYGNEAISNGTVYYQSTYNETVSFTTNNLGMVENTYNYTDYGVTKEAVYGFNGEREDDTGLIYLRNRTYNPHTGTFLQLDTYLGEQDSIITQNRYTAFGNNPNVYVDKGGNSMIKGAAGGRIIIDPPKSHLPIDLSKIFNIGNKGCPVINKYSNKTNISSTSNIDSGCEIPRFPGDNYYNYHQQNVCFPTSIDVGETGDLVRIEDNYQFNKKKEESKEFTSKYGKGYINGQGIGPVRELKMGHVTMNEGGCGPIAVYNALVAVGDYHPLSEIIRKFELSPMGVLVNGDWGTNSFTAQAILQGYGYLAISKIIIHNIYSALKENLGDVAVIAFTNWKIGHFVSVTHDSEMFTIYNWDNRSDSPLRDSEYQSDLQKDQIPYFEKALGWQIIWVKRK